MLFPVINIGVNNYAFLVFIVLHNVTFIMNIIFMLIEKMKFSKKEFFKVYIVFFIYYIMMHLFNKIFLTNYNSLSNLLANKLKEITIFSNLLNNKFFEIIFMIVFMSILMFIGSRVLIFFKGCESDEN